MKTIVNNLLHYSPVVIERLDASALYEQRSHFKPKGLWVSVGSAWKRWCEDNDYELSCCTYVHGVELSEGMRMCTLKNAADIDRFTEEFRQDRFFIDWESVGAQYQGIIISPYCYSRRLAIHTTWYYGWDCASGCIWDLSAIQSFKLVSKEVAA